MRRRRPKGTYRQTGHPCPLGIFSIFTLSFLFSRANRPIEQSPSFKNEKPNLALYRFFPGPYPARLNSGLCIISCNSSVLVVWMNKRFSLFVLSLLALALLFAGCASEQPVSNSNGSAPSAPAGNQQGNTGGIGGNVTAGGDQVPVIDNNPQGQNNSPSQSGLACDVGFQLSSSDVYLIKVNFKDPVSGLVNVQCPDGSLGVDKGSNLFLCERLSSGSVVSAFLDGSRCGSASFNSGSSPTP